MNTDVILKTATGSLGVTMLEVVGNIPSADFMEVGKLILQIIVAIGTLISLFKKKKEKIPTD